MRDGLHAVSVVLCDGEEGVRGRKKKRDVLRKGEIIGGRRGGREGGADDESVNGFYF